MDFPILNAKVSCLKEHETIIIRFKNADEFSGVLEISYDFNFCDQIRKDNIRNVLKQIAEYVIDIQIR